MLKPKFYSQNGEDYLLWSFFGGKSAGFYVDIGAFDGIHFSNTYTFEQMGWHGICVEPNPEIFPICRVNRPGAICLPEACTGEPDQQKMKFFVEDLGLLSTAIINEERLVDIEQRYRKRSLEFTGMKEIQVTAHTFNEMLEQYGPKDKKIDFVSLDTEGNEIDILQSIDFYSYDIRVILVEYDKIEEQKMSELLWEKGNYRFVRKTLHNAVFVKTDADCEKMKNISINCTLQGQKHPKGPKYTPPRIRKERLVKDGKIIWE
jgi:FkbM family methyltransferase